ncbi:hypothetical protein llap_9610 [Limosa lapponica baueri]|uniref:Uncharacterized protein n=1 Tax=Limosa lapponica baueri TaxID=1758121 RepID=A0A2I0U225_LIMLA|nr:hypothetical protein llap_9610 [Limosa lapponica baueri]
MPLDSLPPAAMPEADCKSRMPPGLPEEYRQIGSFLYYWYGNLPNHLLTPMEDLPEQGVKNEAEMTTFYESY